MEPYGSEGRGYYDRERCACCCCGGRATVTTAGAPRTSPHLPHRCSPPPPFLMKTYEMVDDPGTDTVVSWGPGNNSFIVWNTPEFALDLLPSTSSTITSPSY